MPRLLWTLLGIPCAVLSASAPEEQVVEALNAAYSGFDPDNASSPLGVFVHAYDGNTSASGEPYLAKCDYSCLSHYTSQCRVSNVVLNKANGFMQKDWAYWQSMCEHLPQFCNVTISIWPGTGGRYYSYPGIVYASDVAERAVKCAYAFDGSSDMRPNRGCGCSVNKPNCAPNNPNWPCPNTNNACSNRDPLSPLHKITANSTVITACQCAAMGITEDVDPTFKGATTPGVDCLWQGPQFFSGHGQDELRRALKQQHNFVKTATFPWNEIVLDGDALNGFIAADPSHAIAAFYYPLTPTCEEAACYNAAYAAQSKYRAKYGVVVPVIGLDVTDGTGPFRTVPPPPPALNYM